MMPENSQIAAFVLDITQLHKACNRLKQLELADLDEYLSAERTLLRQGEALVRSISANAAFGNLVKRDTEKDCIELFSDREHGDANALIQQLISGLLKEAEAVRFEYELTDAAGNVQFLQVFGDLYQKKKKIYAYFTIIDTTDQKKAVASPA